MAHVELPTRTLIALCRSLPCPLIAGSIPQIGTSQQYRLTDR